MISSSKIPSAMDASSRFTLFGIGLFVGVPALSTRFCTQHHEHEVQIAALGGFQTLRRCPAGGTLAPSFLARFLMGQTS
jgi:hypothetical protein